MVEQPDRLRPVGLQGFHNALAREQRLCLLFQFPDFIDLLVQLHDLRFQVLVAFDLVFDAPGKKDMYRDDDGTRQGKRQAGKDEELLLLGLAPCGAMRQ